MILLALLVIAALMGVGPGSASAQTFNPGIYDFDQDREVLHARDIGALQIAIAPDGDRIIDPRKMRIHDVATGTVVVDLLASLLAALLATGFALDWSLRQGDRYGSVLMELSLEARQLRVLTDLIPTNPQFTNRNNFSQLNPIWK